MNSRERVRTSFGHKNPDRVPLDYVAVPELSERLIEHLHVPDQEALLQRLHVDFRHLDKWGTMVPRYVGPELPEYEDGTKEDMWGCKLKMVEYQPGCFYQEWVDPPLAAATSVSDVERHRWPQPDWFDFSQVEGYCREHAQHCVVGGLGATLDSVGFFRGTEQAMLDMYDNPHVLEAITEKLFEFKYEYNTRLLDAAKGGLDILLVSEDMGGQAGLIVSRKALQRYVFPRLQRFAQLAHRHHALAMLHSDGDIHSIIPDLIDLGIDIINPVQETCPEMDPVRLKREFGDKLCFHGLLDTQRLMPFGTQTQLLQEASRLIETVGAGGGLALAPSNALQIDVPVENVVILYDSVGAV